MDPLSVLPLNSEFIAKRLPCERLAAVLIGAWNDRRSGEIRLEHEKGAVALLVLHGGALRKLRSPTIEERAWTAAAKALPPAQLDFARNYAGPRRTECLKALERLVLLSDTQISAIHTQTITAEILDFCRKEGHFTWTWKPTGDDQGAPIEPIVDPLALICQCLSAASDVGWCKAALSDYRQEALRLTGRVKTTSVEDLQDLTATIERQPESIETLLLRGTIEEGRLLSMVYVLLATGTVELPPPASRLHPPRSFAAPQSSTRVSSEKDYSLSSRAPTLPVPKRSLPPGPGKVASLRETSAQHAPRSTAPDSQLASARSGVRPLQVKGDRAPAPTPSSFDPHREHSAEMSCLKAWLRTQVYPESSERALSYGQKAAAYFPKNAGISFYLGGIHALRGELRAAEHWLARAVELDPEHSEALRELERVRTQRVSNGE